MNVASVITGITVSLFFMWPFALLSLAVIRKWNGTVVLQKYAHNYDTISYINLIDFCSGNGLCNVS